MKHAVRFYKFEGNFEPNLTYVNQNLALSFEPRCEISRINLYQTYTNLAESFKARCQILQVHRYIVVLKVT